MLLSLALDLFHSVVRLTATISLKLEKTNFSSLSSFDKCLFKNSNGNSSYYHIEKQKKEGLH